MREGHEPYTFNFLENNLKVLDADGKEPNYELPPSQRPPFLRADIKQITDTGMVYINFSEPILLPYNNTQRVELGLAELPDFVPDVNIS